MPTSPRELYGDYISQLKTALDALNMDALEAMTAMLVDAFEADKTVFVAGNGGSAATASHMAADFCKTILGKAPKDVARRLRTIALSDNMPLVTAYGNDVSYEDIFGEQLRTLARSGDVLIVITASGNSPNVVSALKMAKEIGVKSIGFLGFTGGKSKDLVDVGLVVESSDYGVVEDAHSILMHMLTAHLKEVVAAAHAGA